MLFSLFGALALAIVALFSGCSENFGVPPSGGQSRVVVQREGFAGPIDPQRVPLLLRGTGAMLFLAADRGTYNLSPHDGMWSPGSDLLGFRTVRALASDRSQSLWLASTGQELFFSTDGGEIFDRLPPPVQGSPVETVAVLPVSAVWPEGAWLAVVGSAVYLAPVGQESWTAAEFTSPVDRWLSFDADGAGRVMAAVESGGEGWLWISRDGAARFEPKASLPDASPLALALLSDERAVTVHADGVWIDGNVKASSADSPIRAAGLRAVGVDAEVFLYSESDRFWWGTSADEALSSLAAPREPALGAGLLAASGGGFFVGADRSVLRLRDGTPSTWEFGGGPLSMGAVVADPEKSGEVYLAGGGRGDVWRGAVGGPFDALGRPGGPSVEALLPDPLNPGALFAATFGVQHLDAGSSFWEDRNDGQSSFLCNAFFGGPVIAHSLAARPGVRGELWLGAINGDGPYRSQDDGRSWQRVHGNLGPLGNCIDEPGLASLTQARAFVFLDEQVWMGAFRGGVFVLDGSSSDWRQRVEGLPDVFGDVVDTCCYEPFSRMVDVRDLKALDDGTLLAATAWGVYRLTRGAERWELSSQGLNNFDVQRLAPLPGDSSLVLAGCAGTVDVPDWLFLSRDGGLSWSPVDSRLRARRVSHLSWSNPAELEAVAVMDWSGAWSLSLQR